MSRQSKYRKSPKGAKAYAAANKRYRKRYSDRVKAYERSEERLAKKREYAKRKRQKDKMELFFEKVSQSPTIDQIHSLLAPVLPYLRAIYPRLAESEDDYRSGEETYGYSKLENVLDQLDYISDRWHCAFRVRWLIDLAEITELPQETNG